MRQRRQRTNFNDDTIEALDVYFAKNPYPDINEREAIARELKTNEDRIQVWFQNKRARYRKKMNSDSKPQKKATTKNAKAKLDAVECSPMPKTAVDNFSFNTVHSTPDFSAYKPQTPNSSAYSLNDSAYASYNISYNSYVDTSRAYLHNFNLNSFPLNYSSAFSPCYNSNASYSPYLNQSYYGQTVSSSPMFPSSHTTPLTNSTPESRTQKAVKPFFRPYE